MVSEAPKFYEVAKKIIQITEESIFVAHNVFFDYQFLQREFGELGYTFRRKLFCTVKNSRIAFPGLKSYSLKNLCRHFKIELKNHHRAYADTKATYNLFKIIKRSKSTDLIQTSSTPSKLEDEKTKAIPESGGVYYFYDDQKRLLYVGKSKNIKNRIKSHFRLNIKRRKDLEMKNQISSIEYKLFPHDLISKIIESLEIKKLKPLYNVSLRRTRYRYEVVLDQDGNALELKHQYSMGEGIPSKSKKHSERIIEQIYRTSFGNLLIQDKRRLLKIIGLDEFNKRVRKVYRKYFYPSEHFSYELQSGDLKIYFDVQDNKIFQIRYGEITLPIKEDPDIKKILLTYFNKVD